MHEEDEEEEPIQHPIHTPRRVSHEFPSPTSLAAHAVAVKSPLSVAVDSSQMQTPQRAPVASTIFSPTAHSHSSNEPLTSPVRSTTTPMSSMHQSPLVSPTTNQPLMRHPEAFTQNCLFETYTVINRADFSPTSNGLLPAAAGQSAGSSSSSSSATGTFSRILQNANTNTCKSIRD